MISQIYDGQKYTSKKRGHTPPSYTKQELKEWILQQENFSILFNLWKESGFNMNNKPSIDRLDDDKPYSFSNIQLMTWKENNDKPKGFIKK